MLCLARDLLCKFRLATKSSPAVSSRLSCWRSFASNKLSFGSNEILSKPKFVPVGGASFVQNLPSDKPDMVCGFGYFSVIYKALYIEGSKALEAGANALDLNNGINAARDEVCAYFKRTARMICTPEEIAQVATAAANGDTQLGSYVAKGMEKVGKDGSYIVAENKELNNEVEFVNALKYDDLCSPYFFTNKRKKICLLKNPSILVILNKVLNKNMVQAIQQEMRSFSHAQTRPLLIFAERVDKEVEGSLLSDRSYPWKKLCVIDPPKYELNRATWRAMLEDLAILTGGQVISEESDMSFISQMVGSCKKVIVSKGMLLIYEASGDQKDIEKRCKMLRYEKGTRWDYFLGSRLKFLCQGARFKFDKASDRREVVKVVLATQNAMKDGILPGGGIAFLNASKVLDKLQTTNADVKLGVRLLENALKMPLYCLASAAGLDGSIVVEKLLDQDNPYVVYDPITGEYTGMMKSGNINRVDKLTHDLEIAVSLFKGDILGNNLPYFDKQTRNYYGVHVE